MIVTKLEKTTIVFLLCFFFLGIFLIFVQVNSIDIKNRLVEAEIKRIQELTPKDVPEKKAVKEEDDPNFASKINVNTATVSDLDRIPGMGKTSAERIVEYRKVVGKFKDLSDLSAVKGLTPKKAAALSKFICFTGEANATPKKLNLNFASEAEIGTLPGVTPGLAHSIVDTRAKKGSFHSLDDLEEVPGLTEKTFKKFENSVEVK